MSKESKGMFLEKLAKDAGFAEKFRECKDGKERLAFAKEAGFELMEEELKGIDGELSEGELDAVAGGLRNEPKEDTTDIGDDTKNKA